MADENVDQSEETPQGADEETQPTASADAEAVEAAEPPADPEPVAETADEPVAEAEVGEETVAEAEEPVAEVEADTAAPVDEAPSADKPVAEAPVAPPPKKKKKRLPRALRPTRTKPKREKPTERRPITRLPKPEHVRGRRLERQGTVVSAAADKTIVVRVDTVKAHRMYKKVIRRSTKLHAHDEGNEAKVGDIVRIVETRPISRMKRWRLQEIVEAAK